ncbi:MAG: hypothetical protein ACI936_001769, partial [Paraglaciecola sp.]
KIRAPAAVERLPSTGSPAPRKNKTTYLDIYGADILSLS